MFYGSTKLATGMKEEDLNSWKIKLVRAILFFIPRANLDNDKLLHKVSTWLLEVNEDGVPNREVALDENGEPLFSAPNSRNYGLWTDSPSTFDRDSLDLIDQEYFERMWRKVAPDA